MEDPIMRWFEYGHLPAALQETSRPYCELAQWIVKTLPRTAERTVSLRKLLEAKDAGVRAAMVEPVADAPAPVAGEEEKR